MLESVLVKDFGFSWGEGTGSCNAVSRLEDMAELVVGIVVIELLLFRRAHDMYSIRYFRDCPSS